ncbi:MAG: twin-arginine translocase subunit TatB [Lysobacter sp.]|nr:MAG: twin-arginine translocase subunit TatB [Lysobacter sp.]
MFDIGASELFLVAIVALIVLGPERLPKAARFAGLWVRRARAQWYSVKSELERELAAEELTRSLRDGRQALRDVETSLRDADAEVRREFDALRSDVERGVDERAVDEAIPAVGAPALDAPASPETADAPPQDAADVRR